MSDELLVTRVESYRSGVPGRCLSRARSNHFVIDEPAYAGGPGEAVTPAEAFLAGISACAVLLVESFARQEAVPIQKVEAAIEGIRARSNPADFREVRLQFQLGGVTQEQAEGLVERFKGR